MNYMNCIMIQEEPEISHNLMSIYCSSIANEYGIKIGGVNKLIPNLGNKSKYLSPYRVIQLYLSLGMKFTKVHRILKLKQSDWLNKYIDFNTYKRKLLLTVLKKIFLKADE